MWATPRNELQVFGLDQLDEDAVIVVPGVSGRRDGTWKRWTTLDVSAAQRLGFGCANEEWVQRVKVTAKKHQC